MIVKHLFVTVKGVPVWIYLKGTGDLEDEHIMVGVSVGKYSVGCDTDKFDKIDYSNSTMIIE